MENPFNQPPFDISDYFPSFTQEEKEAIHRYIMPFLSENNNANKNNASKNDNTNRNDSTNKIDRRIKKDKKNRSEQTKFFSRLRKELTESESRPFFAYLLNLPPHDKAKAIQIILRPVNFKKRYLRSFFEQPCNATFDKLLEKGLDEQQQACAEERLRMGRQKLRSTSRSTSETKPKVALPEKEIEAEQPVKKDTEEQTYPAISEGAVKLLKKEVQINGKKYRVDIESMMHKLRERTEREDWPQDWTEQRRWWRLVYEFLKQRKVIVVDSRERYAPFVRYVVGYCQPELNVEQKAENFGRIITLPMKREYNRYTNDEVEIVDTDEVKKLLQSCFVPVTN